MATSGSKDFNMNRDALIRSAIRKAGGQLSRASDPQDMIANASESLNIITKQWQSEGIGVWMLRRVNIYLAYATNSYSLGPAGKYAYSADAVKTELSADASSGASTITVDSATGIDDTYNIGVVLDDGTLQWTTVNGSPSGTTVTLTDSLTDDASTDAHVYVYETNAGRPIMLDNVACVQTSGNEIPVNLISRDDYFAFVDKDSPGDPNQAYHDPQLTNTKLYVWPSPNNVSVYLKADALIEIDDFDASADDAEFPPQFYRALVWNLAAEILPEYRPAADDGGIFVKMADLIVRNAARHKDQIERFDNEDATISFIFKRR